MGRPRTLLDNPYPRQSREYQRLWYQQHKSRLQKSDLKYRRTPKGRGERLYYGAKSRARKVGVKFSLSTKWVIERVSRGVCEVTGIPFDFSNGRRLFGPSLDRKDPRKGYTKTNVRVVVWCYNAAKSTGTDEEVLKMAEALCSLKKK